MQSLITSNLDRIAALCREHHVQRLYVFGSALRDDFDAASSDVDLRLEFGPVPDDAYAEHYFALRRGFVEMFGRKVDLLTAPTIRNRYLRKEIEDTQELVYAA